MGGGGVPTVGAARERLITAAAALAIALVLGTVPAVYGGGRQGALGVLAVIGVTATLIALLGVTPATWWAVAALGCEYAVSIFGRNSVDVRAPLVGAALLLVAEMIDRSLRGRTFEPTDAGMSRRQLVDLGVLWMGSLGAGSVAVAFGDVGGSTGLGLTVAGVVASVVTLGLVLVLARRSPPGQPSEAPHREVQ